MPDLHPCPACHRHVAATESACPFCGAAQPTRVPIEVPRGRLSRAAVFAAGTTLVAAAAAGCGGKTKPDTNTGGQVADAATAESEADAADTPPPPPPDDIQPMPYGAPPARRRVV
jgi:hypothetical protein